MVYRVLLAAALGGCAALASPVASASAGTTLAIFNVFGSAGREAGQLSGPVDLTMDAAGDVIVADTENHRIQKFARDGSLVWSIGKAGPDGPAPGSGPGEFTQPKDVAVTADGTILVADSGNRRVQRLSAAGAPLATYAMTFSPQSMSVDAGGAMYMADTSGNRIVKAGAAGQFVRQWGRFGDQAGEFDAPFDASVASGFVYVADSNNARIQKFDTDGGFVSQWGTKAADPDTAKPGEFSQPGGVSVTSGGRVFVIDRRTARLDEFTTDGKFVLRFGAEQTFDAPGGVFAQGEEVALADTGHSRAIRLVRAASPGAGSFCDSSTGTCSLSAEGVPSVSMRSGDRSPVRFIARSDICVRLGRGAHLGKEAFFNGKRYDVAIVADGFMVEIPAEDLTAGSVLLSSKCRKPGAPRSAMVPRGGFDFDTANENIGDVVLYDPSGFVRDQRTGKGIPDAIVTLSSSPSSSGPFGFADPLSISPRINPQRTDSGGHYGWDVPDGYYRIRVERFGYVPLRASRVVVVPPPVTDLHVRLRRKPSEQARLIEPRGAVGKLRLGMARATARRAARGVRPRPRLRFRGGRLVQIELRSPRFRTGAGVGVGANEGKLRIAYGRRVKRQGGTYRLGRITFVVGRPNGASGRVRLVRVAG